jgi:hypothetical protein
MKKALKLARNVLEDARVNRIRAWQNAQADLVHCAGYEQALWSDYSALGLNNTAIFTGKAFRQAGMVKRVKLRANNQTATPWKFKVFRYNGTSFDLLSDQVLAVPIEGTLNNYTLDLATPVTVQIGDVPGLYIPNNGFLGTDTNQTPIRYTAGDVTGTDAFATTTSRTCQIELFMAPPFLAVTGDSIPEGHNAGNSNHGGLHDGAGTVVIPWAVPASEIMAQLRERLRGVLAYQNLALGSQTFAWVASTGIGKCHAVKAHTVLVHCGVNDVSAGRSWAQVEADLNTIRAALTTERLLVDEILPWTAGTDLQAATVRTWNASLLTWCAGNGATLVRCHDEMGKVRVSTGELDDLKTAYNQDGVHLSAVGVDALAGIWKRYL